MIDYKEERLFEQGKIRGVYRCDYRDCFNVISIRLTAASNSFSAGTICGMAKYLCLYHYIYTIDFNLA